MPLTHLLQRLQSGDREAMNLVIPLVYEELKKLARAHLRREARPAPLETTSLVHEAFLKLVESRQPSYESRAHFFGIASRVMRQVLVDTARSRGAEKRGAGMEVTLAELPEFGCRPHGLLVAMDDALHRLEQTDPRRARLIEMRYFGGMTAEESSAVLAIPPHTVRRELRLALAWLRKEIAAADPMRRI